MRKTAEALALAVLLITTAAGTQFVNFSTANPYFDGGLVPPDSSATPPRISIFAPQNNTVYATDTIPFSINVSFPESQKAATVLDLVYYEADWQENRTYLYASGLASFDDRMALSEKMYFLHVRNLAGIPDGSHTIRVFADGWGSYIENWYRYSFPMSASSSISFTIDAVSPKVVLSMENITYYKTDIQLNFTVNEPDTQISYSLDGHENATVAGNTTLMNLSYGEHSVTAYVTDEAGNTGNPETIHFTIEPFPTVPVAEPEPEPFPIVPAAAVSTASIAVVACAGLTLTRRKQRKEATKK